MNLQRTRQSRGPTEFGRRGRFQRRLAQGRRRSRVQGGPFANVQKSRFSHHAMPRLAGNPRKLE